MKEYILVILSGICKAVEKTKMPEETGFCMEMCETMSICQCHVNYERQKLEAFEGGAMVVDIPLDLALFSQEFFDQFPSDPYPIDPSIWEVEESWQYQSSSGTWYNLGNKIDPDGFETRLTAVIKPKENSAHYTCERGEDGGMGCYCATVEEQMNCRHNKPEPTIATDSPENLTKEFTMKDRSIANKALQPQPQEPTRKP